MANYAALGKGFSGAFETLKEAKEVVDTNKYGQVFIAMDLVKPMIDALVSFGEIMDESKGVIGWHLNGAVAKWAEFDGLKEGIEIARSMGDSKEFVDAIDIVGSSRNFCCYLGCGSSAKWEIRHGGGPDDYSHSCIEHLGVMMTDAYVHQVTRLED